jgi:hypothetical protein
MHTPVSSCLMWALQKRLVTNTNYGALPHSVFTSLLPLPHSVFTNLLPIPHSVFTNLLPLPHSVFTNLLPLPHSVFTNLLPLPHSVFTNLLPLPPSLGTNAPLIALFNTGSLRWFVAHGDCFWHATPYALVTHYQHSYCFHLQGNHNDNY